MRRALVTLPDGVWEVIDKELKGKLGDGDSEVIRNLVITQLTERGYLLPAKTRKGKENGGESSGLADELEMQDKMIEALVEVLEEKGALRYSDWETRIKKKLTQASSKK